MASASARVLSGIWSGLAKASGNCRLARGPRSGRVAAVWHASPCGEAARRARCGVRGQRPRVDRIEDVSHYLAARASPAVRPSLRLSADNRDRQRNGTGRERRRRARRYSHRNQRRDQARARDHHRRRRPVRARWPASRRVRTAHRDSGIQATRAPRARAGGGRRSRRQHRAARSAALESASSSSKPLPLSTPRAPS